MRNPTYTYTPMISADRFELNKDDYWKNLRRETYRNGLEKVMDFLIHYGPVKHIAEVQVGAGEFVELLREYCRYLDIRPHFSFSEENSMLRELFEGRYPGERVYEDMSMCYQADVVFMVECLPYIEGWRDKVMRLWNSLLKGGKLVIMDSLTPTQFRDVLRKVGDARQIYNFIVDDVAYVNPRGRNRKLKIRVYEKL